MNLLRCTGAAVIGAAVVSGAPCLAQPWADAERARTLMQENKLDEAAALYGAMARGNPFDGFAVAQEAYCLHGLKKYEEALKGYQRAIELGYGRPSNLYNGACAHALMGHTDEALVWLERALDARFAEQGTLETDTDLDSLRANPKFAELTGVIKGVKHETAGGATREAGWAWDLDFFGRRMKQMHWDLYERVSREEFLSEIEKLKKDVAPLSDSQVRTRLRRITAMVGDGHTASRLSREGEDRPSLPVHMFAFTDGVHIIGADKAHEGLIGARVLKVGPLDIDGAMKAVRPYLCVDNEMGYLAGGPAILTTPSILQAIGASPDESGVELTLAMRDGTEKQARVEPIMTPADRRGGFLVRDFVYLHDSMAEKPLFLQTPRRPLSMTALPEHKLVYFWFGGVTNDRDKSFQEFCDELFAFIEEQGAERLVIDMRFNGGGNTGLVRPLLAGLIRSDKINRRGHLWVLIGRGTFSAAQNTVNLLEKQTEAVFVGEPTGSCPRFVGESTHFILPHSRTRVYCSSRYWQHMDSTDDRTWVQPQVAAAMSFADYAAGRDPAMEAVLKWVK